MSTTNPFETGSMTTAMASTSSGVTSESSSTDPGTTSPASSSATTDEPTTAAPTTDGTTDATTGSSGAAGVCGDGAADPGEECDDGNQDDTDTCTSACKSAVCGDTLVLAGVEECDDGNQDDTDACTNMCTNAVCGDGIVGPGEACDDGNQDDTDSCTTMCAAASCGDAKVQMGEECDDGNAEDTDACLATCKNAACGDMVVQAGVEECDDGNMTDTDACVMCKAAKCGDAKVQMGVEECDDGNMADTDACLGTCKAAKCGDGKVQMGVEECDDANMVETDACINTCKAAKCGDGKVQMGVEQCDDGNMVDNDACSNTCKAVVGLKNCKAILQGAPNSPSGLYTIDPDGNGGNPAFQTYCDMVTDGGGWTLILNRNVNSDQNGQPDINVAGGAFDNTRATNWNFDVDLFWTDTTQFMFADKQNDNCNACAISAYDSAIRSDKPAGVSYSNACPGVSTTVNVKKIVGPSLNMVGTAYQCGTSLGWGSCGGKNCHFGVHSSNTSSDGSWSGNAWNEMHFPSAYSGYKAYGTYNVEPTAWCRSCGGGLAQVLNNSTTCCQGGQTNAKARWTIWVR